jgi:hypothetical protein
MATIFINAISNGVGTTEVINFTATDKSIIIGGNLSNLLTTSVPVNIILRRGTTDTYIQKNKRIEAGDAFDVLKGTKLVLASGDKLIISSGMASSIDAVFSILQGVS